MMSLGMATEAQFAELMEGMDADMTVIQVWPMFGGRPVAGGGMEMPEEMPVLDDFAINTFDQLPGVIVASPIIRGTVYMRSGRYVMEAWNVTGVRPAALAMMGYELAYGRFLEESDEYAAVFGSLAELNFFLPGSNDVRAWNIWMMDLDEFDTYVDVINDPISISYDQRLAPWVIWDDEGFDAEEMFSPITTFDLDVVGVLAQSGEVWNNNQIYMDIDLLQELNWLRQESERDLEQEWWGIFTAIRGEREREAYDNAFVRVESIDDTHRVAEAITEMGFAAHYPGEFIDIQRRQQQGVRTLLIAIAAISLLVAAINIANTMITSVTERTKEIGVMKVIGASIKDIRRLFLLEAVMIGILGGIFGIGLSLIGSYVLNNFEVPFLDGLGPPDLTSWGIAGAETVVVSLITPWLLLLALGVAAGVGLISGYFPARRATKLSALAAIRSE